MKTLGVVGGGQLGLMLGIAARRMGMGVCILNPIEDCPARVVADRVFTGAWDEPATVRPFVDAVDFLCVETEHVHEVVLRALPVDRTSPHPDMVRFARDRAREKVFLEEHGFPVVPHASFKVGESAEAAAYSHVGFPAVLKTTLGGYDGKGQWRIANHDELEAQLKGPAEIPLVLERRIDLAGEFSIIVARNRAGQVAVYPPFANDHRDHILDVTVTPAPMAQELADKATLLATELVEQIAYTGLLCIEYFVDADGSLWVNEIAPRPHNSGHVTIEANATDQFEQCVRATMGLPLGATDCLRPGAMANLIGVVPPDPALVLEGGHASLHIYGKTEVRPGRKMGHLTALGTTVDEARTRVLAARNALLDSSSD